MANSLTDPENEMFADEDDENYIITMELCEGNYRMPKPNQLYNYVVNEDCRDCKEFAEKANSKMEGGTMNKIWR